jgi:CTP synthase (UTP-ammonia lyase)
MPLKIAVLGDYDASHITLQAINDTFIPLNTLLKRGVQFDWFATDKFDYVKEFRNGYAGLWVTPGSPYRDMENVLKSIEYTRTNKIPTFGNCGGFQHMAIEYARNVCRIKKADHQETNPSGEELIIVKLACSLVEQSEVLKLTRKDTILYQIICKEQFIGKYFCSYGINDHYLPALESHGLIFTAESEDGQKRAFEIKSHPFFLGTLFQPALSSSEHELNPIIVEFVRRCQEVTSDVY